MNIKIEIADFRSVLGLTKWQNSLLFSLQRDCAINDAQMTKPVRKKEIKLTWIKRWCATVQDMFDAGKIPLVEKADLVLAFQKEIKETGSTTWYYLVLLEAATYSPYFPLDEKDKSYDFLSYQNQNEYLKNFISGVGVGNPEVAAKYAKLYDDSIKKAFEQTKNIALNALIFAIKAQIALGEIMPEEPDGAKLTQIFTDHYKQIINTLHSRIDLLELDKRRNRRDVRILKKSAEYLEGMYHL